MGRKMECSPFFVHIMLKKKRKMHLKKSGVRINLGKENALMQESPAEEA